MGGVTFGVTFWVIFRILKKCRKLGVSAPCGPVRLEKLALTRRVSQTVLSYEVENGKNGPQKPKMGISMGIPMGISAPMGIPMGISYMGIAPSLLSA